MPAGLDWELEEARAGLLLWSVFLRDFGSGAAAGGWAAGRGALWAEAAMDRLRRAVTAGADRAQVWGMGGQAGWGGRGLVVEGGGRGAGRAVCEWGRCVCACVCACGLGGGGGGQATMGLTLGKGRGPGGAESGRG